MLLLTSTTDIVRVVTGSAVSTITVHASYVDNASGTITPGRTNTNITTATTTTVVGSPGASTQRYVKALYIENNNASASCQVTVQHFDGTTSTDLMGVTLKAGENLILDDDGAWNHHDGQGSIYKPDQIVPVLYNSSTGTLSGSFSSNTYLAGSGIYLPYGVNVAGVQYVCEFDMIKTAAGTLTPSVNLYFGTTGTTSDTNVNFLTFGAGTAAADTGKFTVVVNFRSAGSGTSAVVAHSAMLCHSLAATGLTNTGASGVAQITGVSAGFNSSTAGSFIGISFSGGTSFSGTNNYVHAKLYNYRG